MHNLFVMVSNLYYFCNNFGVPTHINIFNSTRWYSLSVLNIHKFTDGIPKALIISSNSTEHLPRSTVLKCITQQYCTVMYICMVSLNSKVL